jgi:phytol kinase
MTVALLGFVKRSRLRGGVGQILDGVARNSLGELYFPIAVSVVFLLSKGDPILFCIPILILTLSDAGAALVGLRYGSVRYGTADEAKSIEGSVAFFLTTFLSVIVSLLLFTETGRPETILIAPVAWSGLDNLFIPLGGFLLLKTYLGMTHTALLTNVLAVLLLLGFVVVWRRRTRMDSGAIIGAVLTGYLIWATVGWLWMLAPLILFISYSMFLPPSRVGEKHRRRLQTVQSVASATTPGLLWLLVAETTNEPAFLFPYTLTFATYLAIIGITRARYRTQDPVRKHLVLESIFVGWILLFVPFVVLSGLTTRSLLLASIAILVVVAAAWTFYYVQPGLDRHLGTKRWLWQSGIATVMSCLGLIPLYLV